MDEKHSYLVCIDGDWYEYNSMTLREVVSEVADRFIGKCLFQRCMECMNYVPDIINLYNMFARPSGYCIEKIFELGYKVYDYLEEE